MDSILECEVDTATDGNLWFPPMQQTIRGRLDFMRMARREQNALKLFNSFPRGVPGQRLRIDLRTKKCSVVEPLHEAEWEGTRDEIIRRRLPIPKRSEDVPAAHMPDWLHEIKRSVDAGHLRIVKGEFPKDLGIETETKPSLDPGEEKLDRLCDLMERLLVGLTGLASKK